MASGLAQVLDHAIEYLNLGESAHAHMNARPRNKQQWTLGIVSSIKEDKAPSRNIIPVTTQPAITEGIRYLRRKEAAAFLTRIGFPIAPQTLANMAAKGNTGQQGGGPPFYKTGWKTVFYLETDLIAWASVRVRRVE